MELQQTLLSGADLRPLTECWGHNHREAWGLGPPLRGAVGSEVAPRKVVTELGLEVRL